VLLACADSAFGPEPLRSPPAAGGLGAGGLDRLGHAVVLAGLPDDRVAVVLPCVVDCDPHAKRQGLLGLGDVAVADAVGAVGGDAEVGVEPVEAALGVGLDPVGDGPGALAEWGGVVFVGEGGQDPPAIQLLVFPDLLVLVRVVALGGVGGAGGRS
jgi:hypothetical protein